MKYEEIKVDESYDVEGEAEKVICKNDNYKVVTTVNTGNFSTSWDKDELKQFKPLPKELPEEGLLASKAGSLAYKLSDGSGYGFIHGRQDRYHHMGWEFSNGHWQPATPDQGEKFIEMLEKECEKHGLFKDTKIEKHADGAIGSGLNSGNYGVKATMISVFNKNGIIFHKGKFATPLKETEELCVPVGTKFNIEDVPRHVFCIKSIEDGGVTIAWEGCFSSNYRIATVNWLIDSGQWVVVPSKEQNIKEMLGKQYTHKKGNTYTVVGFTNDCTEKEDKQFPLTVIYMDQEGRHWSRPLSDWDRSFTLIE